MDAADQLANFRISGSRNGAGIQDRDLALLKARDLFEPRLKQLLLQGGAIGLTGATAEIEDVKCSHAQNRIVSQVFAGHQPIGAKRAPLGRFPLRSGRVTNCTGHAWAARRQRATRSARDKSTLVTAARRDTSALKRDPLSVSGKS